MNNKKNCIIIFVKYPELGKVKSRLASDLDEKIVLDIYKNFVIDLLELMNKESFIFKISFYPPETKSKFQSWLGNGFSYLPQQGNDLGEKMKNAFLATFTEGFEKVLIIGSDSPDLKDEIFSSAFQSLDEKDAVIGPTFDGGYYLIGFKKEKFLADIFTGIEWSTETVFQKTKAIFNRYNYHVNLLQKWQDVDTYTDLKALYERNKNTDFNCSKTMDYLKNLFNNSPQGDSFQSPLRGIIITDKT